MINTIIAYDNTDPYLGDFFEKCATKTKQNTNPFFNVIEINSQSLNDLNVQIKTDLVNSKAFLFISYTHGSETELLKHGVTPFVSDSINVTCFRNSFSYCFACKAGKKLGQIIIDNGAIAFVGFREELKVQRFFDAFNKFEECATSGIISFLSGENLKCCIDKMKLKYTSCIDEFYMKDFVVASWFMEHRDAIIALGNLDLQIDNFK